MRPVESSSAARRVLRQRVRVAGGVLLATGCLVALFAPSAVPSSSSSLHGLAPSGNRQLVAETSHLHFRIHQKEASINAPVETAATETAAAEQEGSCGAMADWERHGGIAVYVLLLLYLFIALAIVCDDYFVASLEKITAAMGLSPDVAGATFMAAGSSAPELFVSLADNVLTKPLASLGVGTIVGSAIFNILVIISLSSLLAGQVLQLDWRPMLRDSLWYCWAIVALALVIWDGQVDIAESALLVGSYAAYILYMSQNARIVKKLCTRAGDEDGEDDDVKEQPGDTQETAAAVDAIAERAAQLVDSHLNKTANSSNNGDDKRAWTIDVERVDHGDGSDAPRLPRLSSTGGGDDASAAHHHHHPHRLNSQSKLNPMFRSKYRMFQYHAHSHAQHATNENEGEGDGGAQQQQPKNHVVAGSLRPLHVGTLAAAAAASQADADAKKLAKTQASDSIDAEEPLGGYFDEIFDVPEGFFAKIWFVATRPIVVAFRVTIPDSKYPQFSGKYGFTATFLIAIAWIAVLSHYTVLWATKFGCLAGIPSTLMGLTIIAAGTSIPDAMSSVLVARDGHGDMAVSNALGSNVFDVLLGLGLPFLLSNLVYGAPVPVSVDDLEISLFMLFGVLVAVVLLLLASKWRLHPVIGGVMAALYAAYVVVSYVRGM